MSQQTLFCLNNYTKVERVCVLALGTAAEAECIGRDEVVGTGPQRRFASQGCIVGAVGDDSLNSGEGF